jgi:hypothetical protein
MFPSICYCVPQCVPNSSSLYPKSFTLSSTLAIYITSPNGGDHNIFISRLSKDFIFFGDGPIKDARHKRKINETFWSPQLIKISQ